MIRARILAALAAALVLVGCQSRTRTSEVSTAERSEYESASERRLEAAKAGLDSLQTELRVRADTTKAQVARQLDSLGVRRQEAERELAELKSSTARRWREMKDEMADMLQGLESGMDTLRTRLRR